MERGEKSGDEMVKGRKPNKYYMYMKHCWWQSQERISNILCMSLIIACKSEVLLVKEDQITNFDKLRVSEEEVQDEDEFKYLRYEKEGTHRLLEAWKVWETIRELWKENIISREVKRKLCEKVVIPAVVYGSETWSLSAREKGKLRCLKR